MSEVKLFQTPPTYCPHQYHSAAEMMSTFETNTRTLRYELRSREIYIEEWTSITSPETLLEPPKTQDESENTIQETPNTQFRMLVSVMPCMPHIDSEKSVNFNPSPPSHMITSHTSWHGNKNCRVRKQSSFGFPDPLCLGKKALNSYCYTKFISFRVCGWLHSHSTSHILGYGNGWTFDHSNVRNKITQLSSNCATKSNI